MLTGLVEAIGWPSHIARASLTDHMQKGHKVITVNADRVTLYNICETIAHRLKGYSCNITTSRLLTAKSIGSNYRFVFVNRLTSEQQEIALDGVFRWAKGRYPASHTGF